MTTGQAAQTDLLSAAMVEHLRYWIAEFDTVPRDERERRQAEAATRRSDLMRRMPREDRNHFKSFLLATKSLANF